MQKIRRSKADDRITVGQAFLGGGFAGVASRTITSPLDVVKISAQVGTEQTRGGFLKSFSNIYQQEGIRGFWKGNGVACLRLFPYNAVQFAIYTQLKIKWSDDKTGQLSIRDASIAGSLSGAIATIVTYPADVVKTRLTVDSTISSQAKYKGAMDAFRVIYQEEGFFAFYRGMTLSLIGVIPFAGGTFMAYEILEHAWNKPREQMSHAQHFMNGCLAAAFAQTFSFPFDTIRKKMQAQSHVVPHSMKPDIEFRGMIDAFLQTIKKNGVLSLWKGTTANLAKVIPYSGVMFMAFEASKRYFLWQNGYTESPFREVPKAGVPQYLKPEELRKWEQEQQRNKK